MDIHAQINRMDALEQEAIGRYLDRTDFDRTEWMNEVELKEYCKLYKSVNGECPNCGEVDCDC